MKKIIKFEKILPPISVNAGRGKKAAVTSPVFAALYTSDPLPSDQKQQNSLLCFYQDQTIPAGKCITTGQALQNQVLQEQNEHRKRFK